MLYGELKLVTLPNGNKVKGFRVDVPNPPKSAFLNLPKNEDVLDRLNKQKSKRRPGPEKRTSISESVDNTQYDLVLFNQMRLDLDGPFFDEDEASLVINKVLFTKIENAERDGADLVVELSVAFGLTTTHIISMPSLKAAREYRSKVLSVLDRANGVEEFRYKIEPAVKLYDSCIQRIEGYSVDIKNVDVPPHHKSSVVVELIQNLEEVELTLDPN